MLFWLMILRENHWCKNQLQARVKGAAGEEDVGAVEDEDRALNPNILFRILSEDYHHREGMSKIIIQS